MKIKPINGKTLGENAPLVLGAVGGAMVGRALIAVVAKPAGATPTDAEKSTKMYIQLGLAAAGYLGYSIIEGTDTASEAAEGGCLGLAIDNTLGFIGAIAASSTALATALAPVTTDSTTVATAKIAGKAMFGLACPGCTATPVYTPVAMNRPRHNRLRMPDSVANGSNHFLGDSVNEGTMLLYAN